MACFTSLFRQCLGPSTKHAEHSLSEPLSPSNARALVEDKAELNPTAPQSLKRSASEDPVELSLKAPQSFSPSAVLCYADPAAPRDSPAPGASKLQPAETLPKDGVQSVQPLRPTTDGSRVAEALRGSEAEGLQPPTGPSPGVSETEGAKTVVARAEEGGEKTNVVKPIDEGLLAVDEGATSGIAGAEVPRDEGFEIPLSMPETKHFIPSESQISDSSPTNPAPPAFEQALSPTNLPRAPTLSLPALPTVLLMHEAAASQPLSPSAPQPPGSPPPPRLTAPQPQSPSTPRTPHRSLEAEYSSNQPNSSSVAHDLMPLHSSPFPTPRHPRSQAIPEQDELEIDGFRVPTADGRGTADARAVEFVVEDVVEAIERCMLITHPDSREVGMLITLASDPPGSGLALNHSGLRLASKSGSEATTVMSARQCGLFRRGLAVEIAAVNRRTLKDKVLITRFQILRDHFTFMNGMLDTHGELARAQIYNRYRHIIDDMYKREESPNRTPHSRGNARAHHQASDQNSGGQKQSPHPKRTAQIAELGTVDPTDMKFDHRLQTGIHDSIHPGFSSNQLQYSPHRDRYRYPESSPKRSPLTTPRKQGGTMGYSPRDFRSIPVTESVSPEHTPRERGRYTPSFSADNVRPFVKKNGNQYDTKVEVQADGWLGFGAVGSILGFQGIQGVNGCVVDRGAASRTSGKPPIPKPKSYSVMHTSPNIHQKVGRPRDGMYSNAYGQNLFDA